jgi:ABC-type microcin C transport system permease subunit YejE
MTAEQKRPLSNLQLELLRLYSTDVSDSQLLEIKKMLADYFSQQIDEEMTALWDKNRWDEKTIETWKNERLRTPY